jgi:hypothetical protein
MKKLLYTIILFISLPAMAKTENEVYPYSHKDAWGLCLADHKPVTDAKYSAISAQGRFVLGQLSGKRLYDIYTAGGKLLQTAASVNQVIHDTVMIAISEPGTGSKNQDSGKVNILFASGTVQHHSFTYVTSYQPDPDHYLLTVAASDNRLGLYGVVQDRLWLPLQYREIKAIGPNIVPDAFLGWNGRNDYKVINNTGDGLTIVPEVYTAIALWTNRGVFVTGSGAYTFSGTRLQQPGDATAAPGILLLQREYDYEGPRGYLHNVSMKRHSVTTWLTDLKGNPIHPLPGYQDSMYRDLGNGLFAIEKRQNPEQRILAETYNGVYVCAIYDARKKKIIAKSDFTSSRIVAAEGSALPSAAFLWSVQTPQRIVYLTTNMDTLAIVNKSVPQMEPAIPKFNMTGSLTYPGGQKTVLYDNGRPVLTFDRDPEQFKTENPDKYRDYIRHPGFYKAKVKGKYGLYKIESPYLTRWGDIVSPLGVHASVILPPEYDDITVWGKSKTLQAFKLRKGNEIYWVDTLGKTLVGKASVPYLSPASLTNGYRLAFECHPEKIPNSNTPRILADRVMILDTLGKVLHSFTCDAKYYFSPENFYLIDETHALYSNGLLSALINLEKGSVDYKLRGFQTKPALVNGIAIGVWGNKNGKELYLPTSDIKKDMSISLSGDKNVGLLFAKPGKKLVRFGAPYLSNGITMYGQNNAFLGVANVDGEVYD